MTESKTSKLRVVEPFRMHGYTLAEVFVSKIGLPPALAMTFDTEDGGEASVTLTAQEATDLMLWLQCALGGSHETSAPLTEAETLLQAWADPLPPNGRLYWDHVEKAREYFRRREVKASERRFHANGTYWSGVPTVDLKCDFCGLSITEHDPRTHACRPSENGKEPTP